MDAGNERAGSDDETSSLGSAAKPNLRSIESSSTLESIAAREAADAARNSLPASPKTGSDSSVAIFRRHMRRVTLADGSTVIDASNVIGPDCYREWLNMRLRTHKIPEPEKTFQRTLTCYLSATDGRLPFTPEEEAAVLKVVRVKQVWPAFAGQNVTIGKKGFRAQGYHEKQTLRSASASPGTLRSSSAGSSATQAAAAAAAAAAVAAAAAASPRPTSANTDSLEANVWPPFESSMYTSGSPFLLANKLFKMDDELIADFELRPYTMQVMTNAASPLHSPPSSPDLSKSGQES